ncbi:hypothetical protein AB205_0117990 [Aquarana catesbeiana]|uniref:Uncharacterized protein n=1 Tax=Aquarana catesbeiana TaxID=8400 RepID=A0A2G9PGY4_AQUCT|nr:hypothetical protein AB205_0117990 [Aquarana catesbeiana]
MSASKWRFIDTGTLLKHNNAFIDNSSEHISCLVRTLCGNILCNPITHIYTVSFLVRRTLCGNILCNPIPHNYLYFQFSS